MDATDRAADRVFDFTAASRPADISAAADQQPSSSLPQPKNSTERLRLRAYATLLVADQCCIAAAFVLANALRFQDPLEPAGLVFIPLTAFLFVVLAFSGRAYSVEALASPRSSAARAVKALALSAVCIVVLFFTLKTSASFSRAVLGLGFSLAVLFLGGARYALGHAIGNRFGWVFIREILIVDGVQAAPKRGQIVLFAGRLGLSPTLNDPHAFDRLGRLLSNCDRVLLSCNRERRELWAEFLKGSGTPVEVLTPELDYLNALAFRPGPEGSSVLIAPGPMPLRSRMLKRALDLAITIPALIILAPLLVLIAVAIKLDTRGPVFFRQARIGQANRHFNVLKFRSMRTEATDAGGDRSASKSDDRITAVGGILRKTSLDELPQLLNVLSGEMSVVGPRPHALGSTAEDKLFWDIDTRYWQRAAVKPGMTGLAQVRGFRGATSFEADLTNRLQADLEYLVDWSIWKDLKIIFKTAKVLVHPNAY